MAENCILAFYEAIKINKLHKRYTIVTEAREVHLSNNINNPIEIQSYVNVDTQGFFCLHPDNAKVAIDINYVEKSLSNTRVRSYSNEGEKFLASLKFH